MGVIRKKTISKGTEGGLKYICDVCSADITATVRIRCDPCTDYDLCVPCFKDGATSREHDPATHPFYVIEQHSIPIYDAEWGADEELCLLEGAEVYGLGSWADIADHIGGYRNKDEVRDHYIKTYVQSENFPLPKNADPNNKQLAEEMPREEFQSRKKRRIEDRKDEAKHAPPATPKQKPTASVPACHEVQGYMPGRLEFETEFANEAEDAVQHMQFDPGDGINPETGEIEPEMELKMVVMDIYNSRLTARADRKKVIFEHGLLEYKKNTNMEKKKTKEEKALFDKAKPFARIMNHDDFTAFSNSLNEEHNLRQAITQLQDWRRMDVLDIKSGEKYEAEKLARAARPPPTGAFDRQGGVRASEKKTEQKVVPDGTLEFTAQELPERLRPILQAALLARDKNANGTAVNGESKGRGPLTNGTLNTPSKTPSAANGDKAPKQKYQITPLPGTQPMKMTGEAAVDLHLLTKDEQELCSVLRLLPKPYLIIKEAIMKEAIKTAGVLKRKGFKDICKIDPQKSARIFEFFVNSGWIIKA